MLLECRCGEEVRCCPFVVVWGGLGLVGSGGEIAEKMTNDWKDNTRKGVKGSREEVKVRKKSFVVLQR